MDKKIILSTVLASAALLGMATTSQAATSSLKSESKLVTVTYGKARLYTNSKLQKYSVAKKGNVYKVDGYRMINGKHFYRVYQQDKNGSMKYKGYLINRDTKELKSSKVSGNFKGKKGMKVWKNLYFTQMNEKLSKEKAYFAKYKYTLGNGRSYYSLYYKDSKNKDKWAGYMNVVDTAKLTSTKDDRYMTLTRDSQAWKNLYFTQKGTNYKGKYTNNFKSKRYYKLNGYTYYSMYRTNKEGKETWCGYVNGNAVRELKGKAIDSKEQRRKIIKDTQSFDHFMNKKQSLRQGKVVDVKYLYEAGNGKRYYSAYVSGKWVGYVDALAIGEDTSYGKEVAPVTTAFKRNNIKRYDSPLSSKKEIGTSKDYYNKDTFIVYDRQSDDGKYVEVKSGSQSLGWVLKSDLFTKAETLDQKEVKIDLYKASLYRHPLEAYKYDWASSDKYGQDRYVYGNQLKDNPNFPYVGQKVTLLASVTDGSNRYIKFKTSGYADVTTNEKKVNTYWVKEEALTAETGTDQFYGTYKTVDVKDGRKYFKSNNETIWKYPYVDKTMNIAVAKTGDFMDDYIYVDKEITIGNQTYQHILVNTADVGWVKKDAFKSNELKAINSSLTGINRQENTFTGNQSSSNPISPTQNEKWIPWQTKNAYAYGIDKDGYEIAASAVKGTTVDTTKRGQSFNFTLTAPNTTAKATAKATVRQDTGVTGNKDVPESFAKEYIIDNSAYSKEAKELDKYGVSKSYGRKEVGSDGKEYLSYIEYDKHSHHYKADGLNGTTTFDTQLFTPNYISQMNVQNPDMQALQALTVMNGNMYSLYGAKEKNRGVIVRYNQTLTTQPKEDLRRLRYIWDEDRAKFKSIVKNISVSPELTVGHGQGLANDGKQLYLLDNSEAKDESRQTYQTNTLVRINASSLQPEQLMTYRYIQRFNNDDGTAWSRTYSNNLAWKPNSNTFYTMYQFGEDHDFIYEVQEHQLNSDGSISSKVSFRVKKAIGNFYKKGYEHLPIQAMAYDSQNQAVTLLGNGQYQAFSGSQKTAKLAYVGNIADEDRESEGIAYDKGDIYLQLAGGSEILKAKNNY